MHSLQATLNMTIEKLFEKVNSGQTSFADLIDDFRDYQRQCKIQAYQESLPFDADALKHECVVIKFGEARQ